MKKTSPLISTEIHDSFDLLCALKKEGFLADYYRDDLQYWWPQYRTFEVVIGVILGQNAAWKKVEVALEALRQQQCLSLEAILSLSIESLRELIKPAGMYNIKASRLKHFSEMIIHEFGSFEGMQKECDRDWLLSQKGIGFESADSILCYAFGREEMVADRYSYRLLQHLGYELSDYHDIKEWLKDGIVKNLQSVKALYGREVSLNYIFARFHGKIDEFVKEYKV